MNAHQSLSAVWDWRTDGDELDRRERRKNDTWGHQRNYDYDYA
ncbi:MAG TPA: hypothetical protein VJX67_07340 [Blastocatellia bacterium]|nr:hypothetical protein [Blastocatellia bacterium]